jgi:hypothetical protein
MYTKRYNITLLAHSYNLCDIPAQGSILRFPITLTERHGSQNQF